MNNIDQKNKIFQIISILSIVVLAFVVYSNIFGNSKHFDDSIWAGLPAFRDPFNFKAFFEINPFRVITFFTLALNLAIEPESLVGFFLFNIIIHIINGLLVFNLIKLVFASPALKETNLAANKDIIALIGALLFIAHPIQTQAVTYIYQRLASISTLFYLLSVLLYIGGRLRIIDGKKAIIHFILAGLSMIFAFFSKENAFTLPLTIMVTEFILFPKSKGSKFGYILFAVLFIIIAAGLFLALLKPSEIFTPKLSPDGETITSTNYLLTQFRVIATYFKLFFIPYPQNFDYYFPVSKSFFELWTILGFLFNLGVIIVAFITLKTNRIISLGIFWIYITLSIESSIIPINDVIFEHRMYLPMFGFILLFIGILNLLIKNKTIAYSVAGAFILVFSILTYTRNEVWKDELTLWNDVVKKSPQKARAYNNRGVEHFQNKDYNQALADFSKALELNPKYYHTYKNLGILYFKVRQHDKAIELYNKFIELFPFDSDIYLNRGHCHLELGNYSQAIKDYTRYISVNPIFFYGYYLRGKSHYRNGENEKALKDLDISINLNNKFPESYYFRGLVKLSNQKFEEAINDFDAAINLKKDFGEAYINKARAYEFLNRFDLAKQVYSKALSFDYGNIVLLVFRGKASMKLKEYDDAINDFSIALRLDSNIAVAKEQLALAKKLKGSN
ncbi:MAG: tetratricopeptide repeat protein [Candidatus Kapabacteria bacterium]|nr:tetratricopeptide repeat protein [Candidatus Kapabacteria bacterium]